LIRDHHHKVRMQVAHKGGCRNGGENQAQQANA
jgi:hypothetical protein